MDENEEIKRLLSAIALQDDQSAYRELFIRLHSRLKQFATSILKSNEEAQDIVSDIFIHIWQKRQQLPAIEFPLLYFFTSVRNQAFNRIKSRKKQQVVSLEEWQVQLSSIFFEPEKLMLSEEMMRQVKNAVNELPPRCRLIFKLIKEDRLKYREAAELLNLSVKTIEAQMAIALRRIGKCLHMEAHFPSHPKLSSKKT